MELLLLTLLSFYLGREEELDAVSQLISSFPFYTPFYSAFQNTMSSWSTSCGQEDIHVVALDL